MRNDCDYCGDFPADSREHGGACLCCAALFEEAEEHLRSQGWEDPCWTAVLEASANARTYLRERGLWPPSRRLAEGYGIPVPPGVLRVEEELRRWYREEMGEAEPTIEDLRGNSGVPSILEALDT